MRPAVRKRNLSSSRFAVLAIGASAGGFTAVCELLSGLKKETNLAVIVAQHLDRSGLDLAKSAVQSATSWPIEVLGASSVVRAGVVYLLPPHMLAVLQKDQLKLSPAQTTAQSLSVIDHLFKFVADRWADRAMGLVLSGEGADGAQGLRDINDAGGLTLVQQPSTAEHRAMPEAALSTCAVDHALDLLGLTAKIRTHAAYVSELVNEESRDELAEEIKAEIGKICDLLQRTTGHEFKHYKTSTLIRRIQRRIHILQLATVESYLELLRKSDDECQVLFNELLINVTSFFRDKEAFEALRDLALKHLIKSDAPKQKIRVWVPGCSTGEEAYTLAILLREIVEPLKIKPEIQIIATDIDEAALATARKGAYPTSISRCVSPERLKKYFTRRAGKYHVTRELREICLFSNHNLITDPPFSQLDLISCRNLLIYLGPHLQKKLFPLFHYSLKPGGYLFLGTSESLTTHKELFNTVDAKNRIAQRKATAVQLPSIKSSPANFMSQLPASERLLQPDLNLIGQRIALDEMPLKYAIVNDECQLLSSSAGIDKYVRFPEGAFQSNLLKLVVSSLRPALRSAFKEAKQEKRKIVNDACAIKVDAGLEKTAIIVQPMPQLGEMTELYWVAFQSQGLVAKKSVSELRVPSGDDIELIEQLEQELAQTRQELDKSVQDLEASNEELKSSNEELLSMNEELQSTNEELEASKEEVQRGSDALEKSNADLENLLSSTEIATLFLDDDHRIQNFTQQLSTIYHVSAQDIGRPLSHITSLAHVMPPLPKAEDVRSAGMMEADVAMADGRRMIRRVTPYRGPEGMYSGLVVTFIDVTTLRLTQERFQTLTEVIPQLVWTCLPDGSCDYLSRQWIDYTGVPELDQLGLKWLDQVIHPDDRSRVYEHWMGAVQGHHGYDIEYRIRRHDGEYRWFQTRGTPIRDQNGKITKWFGTCTDIQELKLAQEQIAANERRLEMMIRTSPSFMCLLSGPRFVFQQVNEHYLKLIGHREVLGRPLLEAVPEIAGQGFIELLTKVRTTGEPYVGNEVPVMLERTPGAPAEKRFVNFVYQPAEVIEGHVEGIFVHGVDVTSQVENRIVIENERENFRNLFKQSPELVCILSGPEHRFEFVNEAHIRVLGFNATGMSVREAQPESVEIHGILDNVYLSGETAELHEISITVGDRLRYFNLTYAPRRDLNGQIDGIMILGTEITEQILSRMATKEHSRALELAINNAPLETVLEVLVRSVEMQSGNRLIASLLLADKEGTHLLHGAAPHLPDHYNEAINGVAIGPNVGSCGTAAFRREPVVVSDIATDPLWKDFKELAMSAGLAACWSMPILTSSGKLLGTFAIYSRTPGKPTEQELQTMRVSAQVTALILERRLEIEERQLVAKENEQRREELHSFFMQMPTPMVILTGPRHHFMLANPLYEQYVGRKVVGKELAEVFTREEVDAYRILLDRVYETGEPYVGRDMPLILRDSEGRARDLRIDVSYTAFRDNTGSIRGILVFIRDVTEQFKARTELETHAKALQTAKEEAEAARHSAETANESKSRFLANMSHEIRTPLSAISGFSDLLRSRMAEDQEANSYIERIARNSSQLTRLINELLDLSKIEAEKFEIENAAVDVDAIIEDVQSAMGLRAEEKSLDLHFKWMTPKPKSLVTDPVRLSQILINVVGNAVKFTEKGSVTVELSAVSSKFQARVVDTGIGLSLAQQQKIFEPFMQADASVTRKYGGTGLGLALSKKLAGLLGGDLRLERSAPGYGTVFVVEIRTDLPPSIQTPHDAPRQVTVGPDSLRGRSILIVDDSPDNRLIVAMFLRGIGASITEAVNGEEGVRFALSGRYDLVLMDMQMPVLDGYSAMNRLKDSGYRGPVVALTAHAFKEERDRCLAAGFTGYITKPVNRATLLQDVCEIIQAESEFQASVGAAN